jgi:hypothetical protein
MSPIITSVNYDATCRTCGASHNFKLDHKTEDFEELEIYVHADLDDRGWVDGECDRCAEKLANNPDRAYDEAVEAGL